VNVLVIDVGGSHVKLLATGQREARRFESGRGLTAGVMVQQATEMAADWDYDVVSLGFPGRVGPEGPLAEPGNLSGGWVDLDFERAFEKPVRVVNDAAMQALGGYDGGRMLFLGLGTGLGSALVADRVLVPLELGSLPWNGGKTLFERLGDDARQHRGDEAWSADVLAVVPQLRDALLADYVLIGGGNVERLASLPTQTRRGGNDDAFTGGFRLWEEEVEPHDRPHSRIWRVVS
jgi:polyphosphate glucokinase